MKKIIFSSHLLLCIFLFTGCNKKKDTPEEPAPVVPQPVSPLPVVSTTSFSSITHTSAVCFGNVSSEGNSALTAAGFCWDTQPAPTTFKSHSSARAGTGSYSVMLTGLTENTTYYVRSYATNASGTAYGSEVNFKTSAIWSKTSLNSLGINSFLSKGNDLFAAGQDGIYKSIDDGTNWSTLSNTANAFELAINQSSIFASTFGGGVIYSTDNGGSWATTNSGLSDLRAQSIAANSSTLIVGTPSGPFLSTNNGGSWTLISSNLSNLSNPGVFSVLINGSTFFAVTYNFGLFVSTDNGINWVQKTNGLPASPTLGSIYRNANDIYITADDGVYLSQNNGETWSKLNIPGSPAIGSFAVNGNRLIAGGNGAAYLSTNNGTSWKTLSTGLSEITRIFGLVFHGDNMFASQNWNGVFKKPVE